MTTQSFFKLPSVPELAENIAGLLNELQGTKIFFVSGGPFAGSLVEELRAKNIEVDVFSEFTANPVYEDVAIGVDKFKESQADLMVSIGGGSAIDTAKSIRLFASAITAGLDDTYIYAEYEPSPVPHYTIPTTAGTGSEATTFAVVYYKGDKYSIDDPTALPEYVALVPEYLHNLPMYHKKATFLDALCQAIESYWSVNSTDESKAYARHAMTLLMKNYQTYLETTDDEAAMIALEAALSAGQAINISKTTAAHAMCYMVTALYGTAHGHAAALCLPKVWRYMIDNLDQCSDPRGVDYLRQVFSDINSELGFDNSEDSISWFEGLLVELDMSAPDNAKPSDLQALATSVNAQRLANNPVPLTEEIIAELYKQAIPGL
ncbi:MAG: phosphonoacetaldehyde reductase [Coriobacteriia bacterium]|nr:phosphonoacetaldehyde reductase [Coriobacteriia bacterium]